MEKLLKIDWISPVHEQKMQLLKLVLLLKNALKSTIKTYHRELDDFLVPGVTREIAKLKYKHHDKRAKDSLKSIFELRNNMSNVFV